MLLGKCDLALSSPASRQAYISSYTSHTKIDRLIFIAEKSAGQPMELEALKIAADELKQVKKTHGITGLTLKTSWSALGQAALPCGLVRRRRRVPPTLLRGPMRTHHMHGCPHVRRRSARRTTPSGMRT